MSNEVKVKITNGIGSNHVVNNQAPTQTIRSYETTPIKIEVPPDTQVKPPSQISFERGVQNAPDAAEEPVQNELVTAETTQEDKPATSSERRDAMKRANAEHAKAIQLQKEARDLRQQSAHFEEVVKKASTNPIELAKAIGMDPTEFLRRFQNEMFNIPNEEAKKPEPTVEEKLQQYETERQKERDQHSQYQTEMVRHTYIQTKILPVISQDTEKFQLINHNNQDASAGFIYDLMNAHFQKTGEELSALEVAEEMENQLQQEMDEKIESIKKIGKFSRHFAALQEEKKQEEVELTPNQLGTKKWTGAQSPVPTTPKLSVKNRSARLDRLKKL